MTGPLEIILFVTLVSLELDVPVAPFVLLTILIIVLHCLLGTQQGKRRYAFIRQFIPHLNGKTKEIYSQVYNTYKAIK